MMTFFIVLILLFIVVVINSFTYIIEFISWNKGKCFCGSDWIHFANDSQGGRGYKCLKCGKYSWFTYPVDRKVV